MHVQLGAMERLRSSLAHQRCTAATSARRRCCSRPPPCPQPLAPLAALAAADLSGNTASPNASSSLSEQLPRGAPASSSVFSGDGGGGGGGGGGGAPGNSGNSGSGGGVAIPKRALGVDYGTVWTGLAAAELGRATPLRVIRNDAAANRGAFVRSLVQEAAARGAGGIVVGIPLRPGQRAGDAAADTAHVSGSSGAGRRRPCFAACSRAARAAP
jgi:hypothetical protein